jgi:hypothetical protein
VSAKIKICIFFAAAAGAQVFWEVVRRQGLACDPVEDAYGGVSEAAGEHG